MRKRRWPQAIDCRRQGCSEIRKIKPYNQKFGERRRNKTTNFRLLSLQLVEELHNSLYSSSKKYTTLFTDRRRHITSSQLDSPFFCAKHVESNINGSRLRHLDALATLSQCSSLSLAALGARVKWTSQVRITIHSPQLHGLRQLPVHKRLSPPLNRKDYNVTKNVHVWMQPKPYSEYGVDTRRGGSWRMVGDMPGTILKTAFPRNLSLMLFYLMSWGCLYHSSTHDSMEMFRDWQSSGLDWTDYHIKILQHTFRRMMYSPICSVLLRSPWMRWLQSY